MPRRLANMVGAAGLIAASVWLHPGHAAAVLPAHPAPCSWSFGSLSTQGALATLELQVNLVPTTSSMSCIQAVEVTGAVANSAGGVPAGIGSDGGPAPVSLLFSAGEYPAPTVVVAWHAYCTTVSQPVYLHLSGAGESAVYSLGASRPCSEGPGASSSVDPPRVLVPDPAVGLTPATGGGYRVAVVSGTVLHQPGAMVEAGGASTTPFVGIAADALGGFWLATSDGGVFSYDGAAFYGSAFGSSLAAPIVGITPTPSGHGYWLVAADGGVFTFGDAHFYGSTGAIHLAAPVVGMAPTADGQGYWLAGADGGVFTFGDAHFHGSAGGVALVAPVIGLAADDATGGYWLGAADGGVFTYDAAFHGSAGGAHLDAPITGITATPSSNGYWLLGGDGGVFTYGDAPFHGSAGSLVDP